MEIKEQNNIIQIVKDIRNAETEEEAKDLLLGSMASLYSGEDIYIKLFESKLDSSLLPLSSEDKHDVINWCNGQVDFLNSNLLWKKREETKKQMSSNYDYISWITDFLKTAVEFDGTGKVRNSESNKQLNNEDINRLDMFVDIIVEYADTNNIPCNIPGDGYSFYVSFDNVVLEVGVKHEDCIVCFAKLASGDLANLDNVISFEQIVAQNKEKTRVNKLPSSTK